MLLERMTWPKAKTRSIIMVGGALVLVLLLGSWFATKSIEKQAQDHRAWVDHTHEVIETLLAVDALLFWTASEGSVMQDAPVPATLAAFERVAAELLAKAAGIAVLTADNPKQAARGNDLVRDADLLIDKLRLPPGVPRRNAEQSYALALDVEYVQSVLHARISGMIASERQLLAGRTAAYTAASGSLATILTVALGLAGLSAILALWVLHRASHSLIEATESRLRSVLDRATDAIFLVSGNGIVRLANNAASRLFGMSIDDFIGQPIANRLAGLSDGSSEVEAVRADGSRFPGDLSIGGDGRQANETVYILRDATERNRLAQLKNEFVSTVSHELRTPLTSIRGSLGLVVAGAAGEIPAKARHFLEIAHNNSGRLVHLVNDILDIEKIESGNLEFQRERLSARDIIEQAIKANQAYADQLGVGFRATATLDDGIDVLADATRIQQVMSNLMSNAAKFSPSGRDVEIAATAAPDNIRISVRDHGPGIPASFRHRIFQRFAQADASDQRQKGGTGLGLSITKAIVEHHGGSIGFDTATGGGTEFWFTLPRMSAVPAAPDPAPPQGDRRRILIVEDDPDIAKLLSLMLEQNGWATATAHNAAEADILLGQGRFDAMTLDIRLPDENGLDLFRRLRARDDTREMPVVIVSAQLDHLREQLQGDVLDVVDWLDKPIDQDRLRDAVRRALRRHRPQDAIPSILHVEDDPDIVQFIRGIMADEAEVIAAPNLAEARRLLAARHFALVIIDAGLPDGSGLDLIDPIRRLEEAPPVLIFSVRDYDASFASHFVASLVKTRTDNRVLHDAIHKLIGGNEATAVRLPAEA